MQIPFIDLDAEIERNQGMSIGEIFNRKGEEEFRRLEASILRERVAGFSEKELPLEQQSHVVALIACGGGTPCFHGNMDWMNQQGLTIWINPPAEIIKKRLAIEKDKRPLIASLSEKKLDEFVDAQLTYREQYYAKAKLQIINPEIPIEQIIKKINHA